MVLQNMIPLTGWVALVKQLLSECDYVYRLRTDSRVCTRQWFLCSPLSSSRYPTTRCVMPVMMMSFAWLLIRWGKRGPELLSRCVLVTWGTPLFQGRPPRNAYRRWSKSLNSSSLSECSCLLPTQSLQFQNRSVSRTLSHTRGQVTIVIECWTSLTSAWLVTFSVYCA